MLLFTHYTVVSAYLTFPIPGTQTNSKTKIHPSRPNNNLSSFQEFQAINGTEDESKLNITNFLSLPNTTPTTFVPSVENTSSTTDSSSVENTTPYTSTPSVQNITPHTISSVEDATPHINTPSVQNATPRTRTPSAQDATPRTSTPSVEDATPRTSTPLLELTTTRANERHEGKTDKNGQRNKKHSYCHVCENRTVSL